VLQLFSTIEAAHRGGAQLTPRATAFLADLSKSLARHLKPGAEDFAVRLHLENETDDGSISSTSEKEALYPEGGYRAWLVVFGSWCGLLASIGMTNIMASFQTYISQHQLKDYDESTIGWIFSLYAFLAFFGGVYVGPVFDKYGPRWLVLSGSLFMIADMMALGFCAGMNPYFRPLWGR
jgi:Major Facilitator Superfamily